MQTCGVLAQGFELFVVELGGHLVHREVIGTAAVSKIRQLASCVVSMLTT